MVFLRKILFFLVVTLAFVQSEPGNAGEAGRISIQFENSLLSVDVEEAKLLDVIVEFEKITRIYVPIDSLPEEEVVNLKFDSLPLKEAIDRLFPYDKLVLNFEHSKVTNTPATPVSLFASLKSWFWNTFSGVVNGDTLNAQVDSSRNILVAKSNLLSPSFENSSRDISLSNEVKPPLISTSSSKNSALKTNKLAKAKAKASEPKTNKSAKTKVSPTQAFKASNPVVTFSDVAAFGSMTSKAQSTENVIFSRTFFPPGNTKTAAFLSSTEVTAIVTNAADSLDNSDNMVVAVVDRAGNILGIFRKSGGTTTANQNTAVALARTAAFFSHNQAALTSRTVRFISGEHFPPGIKFTPNAALYGIEHNNRGCDLNMTYLAGQSFPQSLAAAGGTCDNTSSAGCGQGTMPIPGSFPLYKGGSLVGGVGVFGIGPALTSDPQGGLRKLGTGYEAEEFAAVSAAVGFEPPQFSGGGIFIDGIRLPGAKQTTRPAGFSSDSNGFSGGSFSTAAANGTAAGSTSLPSGFLVGPTAGGSFTVDDLNKIINQARTQSKLTRAAIRLPYTETARMVFAIGDTSGNILAVYRQSDSTVFSLDVAVTKARNVAYFSGTSVVTADKVDMPSGTAVTNRTISFGSQRFFPSGLDFTGIGPYRNILLNDADNPCSQGRQATSANHSGIVFFPGSIPLYKNGVLIGALGVSGDGVEQDDYVAAAGAAGYEPDASIRSDQYEIQGVRMPFLKFPRNPKNLGN
jgi:uncharacterized protein GlcG (DUF336 family)